MLFIVFSLSACGLFAPDPCSPEGMAPVIEDLEEFGKTYYDISQEEWDSAKPGDSISNSISLISFQTIQKALGKIEVPVCLEPAKALLNNYIEEDIQAYTLMNSDPIKALFGIISIIRGNHPQGH